MNATEVRRNNLATELMVMGLVKAPSEVKLLSAPKKPRRRSFLDFDPKLEVQYLVDFPEEDRAPQLRKEVETSLKELFLSQTGHAYKIDDGRLVDAETGLDIEKITLEGCVQEELEAIQQIKRLFGQEGAEQVVYISQRNKDLGYPDNIVDIWLKCGDGKIRVLRSKVVGNEVTLGNFYKNIGGKKENPDRMEILADPVEVTQLRLSEILDLLVTEQCETKFGKKEIEEIAGKLIGSFETRFKSNLTEDSDIMLRYYLAVKDAIINLGKEITEGTNDREKSLGKIIDNLPKERYLSAAISIRETQGGSCGTRSLEGSFAKQGWILEMRDGKLKSHFGSTEGLTYCERCGCWHAGAKCPYCDKG